MKFGILSSNIGSYSEPRTAVRVAQAAERAGWDAYLIWDHLAFVWEKPAADPWVTLGAVAVSTERILIGTGVTPVARRRPQVVAHELATLDRLAPGRVVFGAGLGGGHGEFERFGEDEDPHARAELLDEGLDVIRALLSGERVDHQGEHFTVDGVTLAPGAGAPADLDRRDEREERAHARAALRRLVRGHREPERDDDDARRDSPRCSTATPSATSP